MGQWERVDEGSMCVSHFTWETASFTASKIQTLLKFFLGQFWVISVTFYDPVQSSACEIILLPKKLSIAVYLCNMFQYWFIEPVQPKINYVLYFFRIFHQYYARQKWTAFQIFCDKIYIVALIECESYGCDPKDEPLMEIFKLTFATEITSFLVWCNSTFSGISSCGAREQFSSFMALKFWLIPPNVSFCVLQPNGYRYGEKP